jgi:hypothetical protein
MYTYAPTLKAAASTVFMVWLRPCAKAFTYTQDNKNTDHSQTLVYVQAGLDPTIPVIEEFHFDGLVSNLQNISILLGGRKT